jgi:hypothetical protein
MLPFKEAQKKHRQYIKKRDTKKRDKTDNIMYVDVGMSGILLDESTGFSVRTQCPEMNRAVNR